MFPSLRRPGFAFFEPLEDSAPDMVGTARGRSYARVLEGGGGGRQGAIGGGGFSLGLLVSCCGLLSGSLMRNFSPGLDNLMTGILNFQVCWSLGRFLMIRRTGIILFDFEFRMYITVEIITVTPTSTRMIKVTMPKTLRGLSLLFIKNTAIGPLRGVCKRAQIQ